MNTKRFRFSGGTGMRTPAISKSSFIVGTQCPCWLWIKTYARGPIRLVGRETLNRFTVGHEVGNDG